MTLENIVIVLDRPEESRNVGSVCRAMANSGLHTLRIVGRKEDFDEERVRILAIHAASIWENAQFFSSITEAVSDCVMAAGTTRRRGKKRMGKLLLPEEFTEQASAITDGTNETPGGKVAVVFGNERTGLEDDELLECTLGVTIPSCDEFASLNLSHAVQIMGYHIFRATKKEISGYTPVSLNRLEKTVSTITDSLEEIGFFSKTGKKDMALFWRNLLSRSALSESEAKYIEMVFNKAAGFSKKNGSSK